METLGTKQMEVNVQDLLFTQDSIKPTFRKPYQDQRIDDTVISILQGERSTTDFRRLQVVSYEGRLWSLDNRRLWIFKKAKILRVTVDIVPYHHHPRFAEVMADPELKQKLQEKKFFPAVRGKVQKKFFRPGGGVRVGLGTLLTSSSLTPSFPSLETSPLLPQHSDIRLGAMKTVVIKQMEVNVQELLFTQDSIEPTFRTYQDQRIDDTVISIVQGKRRTTDFPRLQVVSHEGRLWSLDNRRLWIFKKAKILRVTVDIVPYHHHPRMAEVMANPELKQKLQEKQFLPTVRGKVQEKSFVSAVGRRDQDPRSPSSAQPPRLNIRSGTLDAASRSCPEDQQLSPVVWVAKRLPVSVTEILKSENRPRPLTESFAIVAPKPPVASVVPDRVVIDMPRSETPEKEVGPLWRWFKWFLGFSGGALLLILTRVF